MPLTKPKSTNITHEGGRLKDSVSAFRLGDKVDLTEKEVIGYYAAYRMNTYPTSSVDVSKFTTINYCFLDISWGGMHGNPEDGGEQSSRDISGTIFNPPNGSIVLGYNPTAEVAAINTLKAARTAKNPKLKIILLVGGYTWTNRFSDMCATSTTRTNFVTSCVSMMRELGVDGIGIDWEFPGQSMMSCTVGRTCDRPEDKTNLALLLAEMRTAFDVAGATDGKHYNITLEIPNPQIDTWVFDPGQSVTSNWFKTAAQSCDWMNLMGYDIYVSNLGYTGHNAPLYADPANTTWAWSGNLNIDWCIERFMSYGCPANKLSLSLAMYGHSWTGVTAGSNNGQYRTPSDGVVGNINGWYDFHMLIDQGILTKDASGEYTVANNGYTRYWNNASKVPYLYNSTIGKFISYDDTQSLREKTKYAKDKGFRGVGVWELSSDVHNHLIPTVVESFTDRPQAITHVDSTGDMLTPTQIYVDKSREMWGWIYRNQEVTASKILKLNDAATIHSVNSSSTLTITLPNQYREPLPTGWFCRLMRAGSGTVMIATQTGDTIVGPTSIATQWDVVEIYLAKAGSAPGQANTWVVTNPKVATTPTPTYYYNFAIPHTSVPASGQLTVLLGKMSTSTLAIIKSYNGNFSATNSLIVGYAENVTNNVTIVNPQTYTAIGGTPNYSVTIPYSTWLVAKLSNTSGSAAIFGGNIVVNTSQPLT